MKYAKILLNLPLEGPFDYEVPDSLAGELMIGKRCWVNFGVRRLIGYIVGISDTTDIQKTKPLLDIIDKEPILNKEMFELTKELATHYLCSWGEAIEAAVPSSLKKGKTTVRPRTEDDYSYVKKTTPLSPTQEQKDAINEIARAIEEDVHKVFLLHGVTGSGKTEVYLQVISRVIEKGRSCIVLVPEISLTPQTVERFKERFSERVAVFHSRLTAGQKYVEWKKLKEGICNIVVGARSAIFSPVKNLGLIVVDEEHDTSYKQQDVPRYNAVDVAIMRARRNNAAVILGSATPSLESYFRAENNQHTLLELKERIHKRPLPEVHLVDMREEHIERRRRRIIFSRLLREQIERALRENQQAILFLNRRGFSTYANCKKCGHVEKCNKCNVALNYHSDKKSLVCHYCNYQKDLVQVCPICKGAYIDYFGFGTQRVESELHRYFPSTSISRMDTDATKKRLSHKTILKDFARGKTQILVGTQMVAKGHDFPQVTLVGVILADTALNLPDFRAGEHTFQLLTQVAGRAGRGVSLGEVVIQSYVPNNYTIVSAIKHDYKAFYKKEIALRRELTLPPYSHLIKLTVRSYKEQRAKEVSLDLARHILKKRHSSMIDLSGPSEAFVYRLRRQYRWNIILKVKELESFNKILKQRLKDFKRPSGVVISIDVDTV